MLNLMQIGGLFMWPIFVLLVLSFAVILEKITNIYLYQFSFNNNFKIKIKKAIYDKNLIELKNICSNKNSISNSIQKAINIYEKNNLNEFELENIHFNEIKKLEKNGFILGISISICPQLGLLGTVTGMISSFAALSKEANEELVAAGISEALYTTAFGLIVAIFALVFHIIFNKRIDYLNNEIYLNLNYFNKAFNEKNK
ncbi:MotA/TolQ/ExbB proton channel family protein [Campylobacter sp. RM12640]|uniref:MotA/TolQ/ExbB proton channel family protein n=1 Tax=unclassified Campylobacter TaxID=2593542 RepID=UPI003014B363|nr:MotA/TolQ/ExbB proton channel family protein [Campylobacter sp. RM12640]MBZ7988320.1 MotA/TolQ/ExbB proton channel family protein [Campylobacter sp. RM12635]